MLQALESFFEPDVGHVIAARIAIADQKLRRGPLAEPELFFVHRREELRPELLGDEGDDGMEKPQDVGEGST